MIPHLYGFFCIFLLFMSNLMDGRQLGRQELHEDDRFQTIQVNSLVPSDNCNESTRESGNGTILKLLHRRGRCSNSNMTPFSPKEILLRDKARVKMLHYFWTMKSGNGSQLATSSVELPAYHGDGYGTGNFIVEVLLGTPPALHTLEFDTGSDTTWVYCSPCVQCPQLTEPLFDPSRSITYRNLPCGSSECSSSPDSACSGNLCTFSVEYGDNSVTSGVLSSETLILSNDIISNFVFGCSNKFKGLLGDVSGLAGFSKAPLSFIDQTFPYYGGFFSYCLPSSDSYTGFLALGNDAISNQNLSSIPFSDDSSFYYIDLTGISVGGVKLPIPLSSSSPELIFVDSGTTISQLSSRTYRALKTAFAAGMSQYPAAEPSFELDTCFDLRGYKVINVPKIVFTFNDDVQVAFPYNLYEADVGQTCLAFSVGDESIIGNTQQKSMEVVFDTIGQRMAFVAGGCN